jgi:ribosomal-protein-alanine N-acetyltransferase
MAAAVHVNGIFGKLQVRARHSITAFGLMLGSLITKKWMKETDKNITTINRELLSEVLRLYNESFTERSEKLFTLYTRLFKRTTYVYVDEKGVKGYCLYLIKPSLSIRGLKKTAILDSFAVDDSSRGQGIGTRLLQKSLSEMRSNSVEKIILHVAKDNMDAISLYEKTGFEITDELMDICGTGKECYQMELTFDHSAEGVL